MVSDNYYIVGRIMTRDSDRTQQVRQLTTGALSEKESDNKTDFLLTTAVQNITVPSTKSAFCCNAT